MPDASDAPIESANEETAPKNEPEPEPEPKEQVTVQGGRRRGKRKIMKKKTVKDDEGYLGMYLQFSLPVPALYFSLTGCLQSRLKSLHGNLSRRMSQRPRPRRKLRLAQRGKRRGKEISCHSLLRSRSPILMLLLLRWL